MALRPMQFADTVILIEKSPVQFDGQLAIYFVETRMVVVPEGGYLNLKTLGGRSAFSCQRWPHTVKYHGTVEPAALSYYYIPGVACKKHARLYFVEHNRCYLAAVPRRHVAGTSCYA